MLPLASSARMIETGLTASWNGFDLLLRRRFRRRQILGPYFRKSILGIGHRELDRGPDGRRLRREIPVLGLGRCTPASSVITVISRHLPSSAWFCGVYDSR